MTVDAYAIYTAVDNQLSTVFQLSFALVLLLFIFFFVMRFFYMKLSWNFTIKCTERKYFFSCSFIRSFVYLFICCVLFVNYHTDVASLFICTAFYLQIEYFFQINKCFNSSSKQLNVCIALQKPKNVHCPLLIAYTNRMNCYIKFKSKPIYFVGI